MRVLKTLSWVCVDPLMSSADEVDKSRDRALPMDTALQGPSKREWTNVKDKICILQDADMWVQAVVQDCYTKRY